MCRREGRRLGVRETTSQSTTDGAFQSKGGRQKFACAGGRPSLRSSLVLKSTTPRRIKGCCGDRSFLPQSSPSVTAPEGCASTVVPGACPITITGCPPTVAGSACSSSRSSSSTTMRSCIPPMGSAASRSVRDVKIDFQGHVSELLAKVVQDGSLVHRRMALPRTSPSRTSRWLPTSP